MWHLADRKRNKIVGANCIVSFEIETHVRCSSINSESRKGDPVTLDWKNSSGCDMSTVLTINHFLYGSYV